jgi:adhesin transport system outer membrane protein
VNATQGTEILTIQTGVARTLPAATLAAIPAAIHVAIGAITVTSLALAGAARAQTVDSFGAAVTTALASNPAVTRAYYEFEATRESERVEKGDLLPSVDLSGDYSWQERQTPIADFGDYEADSLRFSITQLLFDGFQSRDEMRAKRYEKLARYYDFYGASQETALAATEAYLDTVLFQQLVRYAEDNYVTHRQVYNKIAERAAAGVSQRVDLEQATARLALAESNLLTEVTNLHDTRTEFQRVVGQLPGDELPMPSMPEEAIPATRDRALSIAYTSSPEINRSIEEMRAARESHNATRGPLMPRLDLRYRNEQERNIDGILGDYDLEAVEVVMSYNLYRGGADIARRREFSNRYYAAIEARKDACLAVRRETMIAFNNVDVLRRQVAYLTQQLTAQDKTRRAYNDQFDIGQRSLLDLLDSQNEYFDTQRALVSARTQLLAAQARTLAQVGVLTQSLDVEGFNADKIAALQLKTERRDSEEIAACPEGVPGAINIDQEAIFRRLDRSADRGEDVFSGAEAKTPADRGIDADWLQQIREAPPPA